MFVVIEECDYMNVYAMATGPFETRESAVKYAKVAVATYKEEWPDIQHYDNSSDPEELGTSVQGVLEPAADIETHDVFYSISVRKMVPPAERLALLAENS